MVAEQRETVQRIDADTTDIADNISGAQRELLKYYASISSNRWLMIKVFGAIIVMVRFPIFSQSYDMLRLPTVLIVCACKLTGLFMHSCHTPLACADIFRLNPFKPKNETVNINI